MPLEVVEESSPRSKEELDAHTDMVIQREKTLRMLHPNMSEEDIYRLAESYVSKKQMQITKQQDLPSRDAKPGSGNHNNKHNLHGEDGRFVPKPNPPSKSPSKSPSKQIKLQSGRRFRTGRRVTGNKVYSEYLSPDGNFIDISLNLHDGKFTREELNSPEFPANVAHWKRHTHKKQYMGLDITTIPEHEKRYFGGRPWICNSEYKQDSCGLAVKGLGDLEDNFQVDKTGLVRQQCFRCRNRKSIRDRDALRKKLGKTKYERKSKTKNTGYIGNQNARKYPENLTPKQRYAIRKGRGYWDEDTQSFKTGRRPI